MARDQVNRESQICRLFTTCFTDWQSFGGCETLGRTSGPSCTGGLVSKSLTLHQSASEYYGTVAYLAWF